LRPPSRNKPSFSFSSCPDPLHTEVTLHDPADVFKIKITEVMKNRLFFPLLCFVFAFSVLARAQDADDDDDNMRRPARPPVMKPTEQPSGATFACPYEKDFQVAHKFGTYTLRLLPVELNKVTNKNKAEAEDDNNDGAPRCRAQLTTPGGKKIIVATDWALAVDPISGTDINGDGRPEIVLNGYNGGVRCCYTSYVITLERKPELLHEFHNSVPLTYEKQLGGATLIRTADGAFDYFLVPHAMAVVPAVLLQMKGDQLVDISSQFPEIYDKKIEQARAQLTPEALASFRKADYRSRLFTANLPTVQGVLTIVLNYAYSGREEKAWQALTDMWPASDAGRAKSLILERRNRGLLANLRCDCRPAVVAREAPQRRHKTPDETTDPRIRAIIED
jgi:hypothetical protein